MKLSKPAIISAAAAGAVIIIGAGYYYATQKQKNTDSIVTYSNPSPSLQPTISTSTTTAPSPTIMATGSQLVSLDNTWNQYTNSGLGFTLKIPKETWEQISCTKENNSYHTELGLVPIKVFEDTKSIYIKSEYTHKVSGESQQADGTYTFSKCDKVVTSLSTLKAEQAVTWNIKIVPINSDAELDQFLKQEYGKSCSLGTKTAATQTGVFDIQIKGDGKDLAETECPINYRTVVKYYPAKHVIAKWDMGQDDSFGDGKGTSYDDEMKKSFKFL
jgi:hypothetical protein